MKRPTYPSARRSLTALGICAIAAIAVTALAQTTPPVSTPAPAVNQHGPTIKDAYAKSFLIGMAGDIPGNYSDVELGLIKENFTIVTPENCMKPALVHPEEGTWRFERPDALVKWCEENHIAVHGHTLVWHAQTNNWFFAGGDKAKVTERLKNHITTLVGHFKGRIRSWDVVNEAINDRGNDQTAQTENLRNSQWLQNMGPQFLTQAFKFAHEADPDVHLYYNDYNIETGPKHGSSMVLLKRLIKEGAPIYGVGIQGHWNTATVPFEAIDKAISDYESLGLKVSISELDLTIRGASGGQFGAPGRGRGAGTRPATPASPQDLKAQADAYARLFGIFLKHKDHIERVTFWGLNDRRTWRFGQNPLIFDANNQRKPAYVAIVDEAQRSKKWSTRRICRTSQLRRRARISMDNLSPQPVIANAPQRGNASGFKLPGLRWWMISLIMLGSILNYLTRNTLSVAQVRLQDTLHITERQYSWITGAFQGSIMLQPICGYVLDVVGLRIGVAVFVVAWSLINMAHGLAGSWRGLAFLRGLMGFAEGSANPAGVKATAEWFPARERGLAGGIYNIGASFGSMVAPPLVAAAIYYLNWQSAFIITGAMGLVWVVLWLLLYRPPSRHPWLSQEERQYIVSGQEKSLAEGERPSIWRIMSQPNFWGIAIPRFLADPTWVTLSFWLPLYLNRVRGWDLKQIALFAWMPFLAADLGCIFGGTLSAALQKHWDVSVVNARRISFTVGACLMTSVALAGRVTSPYVAILLFSVAGFAHQTLSVTVITMASDLFRRSEVATVAGMAGTLGNAGALTFSLLIGALVAWIGYSPFFACLSILDILGAIVLWTVVRAPREEHGFEIQVQ